MTSIEQQFGRLSARQRAYRGFCVRNRGRFIDISLKLFGHGVMINRDHRSPKIFVRFV